MERLAHDLRLAARALRKSPGFTAVAVLSLGLGIGANTAIFSLIHAAMLRTLPVERPEELVLLTDPASAGVSSETSETGERSLLAWQEFDALRQGGQVFEGMYAAQSSPGEPDARLDQHRLKLRTQLASGEFFGILRVAPVIGRAFTPDEDHMGANNAVAVISYGFWQRQFTADPRALGQTLRIGTGAFKIIGVAPAAFHGMVVGVDVDAWIPLSMQRTVMPGHDYLTPRDTLWLQVGARLKPGVSRTTAQAAVNVAFQQLLQSWAGSLPTEKERKEMLDQRIRVQDGALGSSYLRGQFGDPLVLLMAMVGMVLLIACANIANLTLARATGRQKEMGVRMALGAGRGALIRQILAESLLVAAAGGVAGALLAIWGSDMAIALVAGDAGGVVLDGRQDPGVFVFTALASLSTVVLFGLAPALRATRLDVCRLLALGARGMQGNRGSAKRGRWLVAAQVALSLVLLVGAALLVRNLNHMAEQPMGLDRDHLIMTSVDAPAAGYKGPAIAAVAWQLLDQVRAIPGVRAAALSDLGVFGGDSADPVSVEGYTNPDKSEMRAAWTLAGPGYFSTVGAPVLRGRELTEADGRRGLPVCVINQALANFFFKDRDPIGLHITDEYPTTRTRYEIVGVVADMRYHRLKGPVGRRFYGNFFHPIVPLDRITLLIRTRGAPEKSLEAVRQAVGAVNPAIPILLSRTVNQQIGRRLAVSRMLAQLGGCFGMLALLMAAVGVYGVMSYAIGRRTGEIGLRMALGASQSGVLRMVLRETAVLLAAGAAAGLPCSVAAAYLLRGMLDGVTPADPLSIVLSLATIAGATLLAGYVPARRASRVDPMQALRCE
jgi:predicted permease